MSEETKTPKLNKVQRAGVKNKIPKMPDIEIVDAELEFDKRPIEDILADAETIDTKLIAQEVVEWATANVESYIDNHVKIFKLDLVLDNTDSMQEVKKLQDLYRAIPEDEIHADKMEKIEKLAKDIGWDNALSEVSDAVDDEKSIQEIVKCREKLNNITEEAHKAICRDEEGLDKLFERLVYYYEVKALRDGEPIIQKQSGVAKVIRFEYEAFSMGMKIARGEDSITAEGERKGKKQIIKQYTIPEGFSVWVEISFKPKELPKSLF